MHDEMEFHMAAYAEDLVRAGVAPAEARRRARAEFGSAASMREECREAIGLRWLDEAAQDLAYAARMLRRNPGFAAVAILTLAIGIGLNSACFTVVDAWVLRPLPFAHSERLAAIWSADAKRGGLLSVAAADLEDWRQNTPSFEAICGFTIPLMTLLRGDAAVQLTGVRVSAEFFRMLGVTPQLGRIFLEKEDRSDAPRVAIVSDGLWRDAFAGDPDLVGRTVTLDGRLATIVGILPASFHLPLTGRAAIWMPLALSDAERADRGTRWLSVIGRLRPGVRLAQAADILKTSAARLEQEHPATNAGRTVTVTTLTQEIGRKTGREPALYCFGLVGCVLLLACANVANLTVGRALGREREMSIRLAIGAGRGRLLRQLLTENLVLYLAAAVLSVGFAEWGTRWIQNSLSYEIRGNLPNFGVLRVNGTVLLYTLGIAVAAGLIFGFAPAARLGRPGASRRSRLTGALVVFEMALALIIVVAAGLMAKGMTRMYAVNPGFQPEGLVTARLVLADAKYADPARAERFFESVLQRVTASPGVQAAAAAQFVPYQGNYRSIPYLVEGVPDAQRADRAMAIANVVTPG
jgi:predicted permease